MRDNPTTRNANGRFEAGLPEDSAPESLDGLSARGGRDEAFDLIARDSDGGQHERGPTIRRSITFGFAHKAWRMIGNWHAHCCGRPR